MTPNEVRFYGALTSLIYRKLGNYQIVWFDLRFSNYGGFNLIDLTWDVDGRRYSYRQALTGLEVLQLARGALYWKVAAKVIAARINHRIRVSIQLAEAEVENYVNELLPTDQSDRGDLFRVQSSANGERV